VVNAIATGDKDCNTCHPAPHAPPLHDTTVPVTCQGSGCHAAATNLTPIHSVIGCAGCHGSSDPAVAGAITAGDTACSACHPADGHTALHDTTPPASCEGAGCHTATNLIPLHTAIACTGCHDSTDPAVVNAIATGDKDCNTCHPGGGNHAASHVGGLSSGCQECHRSNIAEEHENNCTLCHESTDSRVIAAIVAGGAKCDSCHTPGIHAPGFFAYGQDYYKWTTQSGPWGRGTALADVGDNPTNPGAHANYLATTAKCGMCHSVHRAAGDGIKLLPTGDATCAGCHTGGTAITAKLVTWTPYDTQWVPTVDPANPLYPVGGPAWMAATPSQRSAAINNKAAAGGAANGGGPHNDSALDLIVDGAWDGTGDTPDANYELGHRYGCATRRCHATNPHGANSSKYKLFAAKLLFNEPANADQEGDGTYGGLDAVWDDLGATDASVERFVTNNSSIVSTTPAGDILIHGAAPDANETHALVAGLTCGRPSNPSTGEDECHAEASYAIVDMGITETRNHATKISGNDGSDPLYPMPGNSNAFRTDNTGAEASGWGGNDNRDSKTGHVAGTFAAVPNDASYAPVAGCTSCHDQTDAENTVAGNFTFPHGQVAAGASNLSTDGVNPLPAKSVYDPTGPGIRSRIWAGYGAKVGGALTYTAGTDQKAYDGQCLKCHRDTDGTSGIGVTK